MKTKNIIILLFSIAATIFVLLTACEKLDPEIPEGEGSYVEGNLPQISVGQATSIDYTSALVPVSINSTGGRKITRLAVCYSSATANPTIEDQVVELREVNMGESNTTLEGSLINLSHNTTYNYRAYAINSEGEVYSNTKSFATPLDERLPQVTTKAATEITATSAMLNGTLTNMGESSSISQHGFVWATHSNPGLSDNKIELGTLNNAPADFSRVIENLTECNTYYVRAYATNNIGTFYGEEINFVAELSVTDIDGNTYNAVQIGNQIWMAENLKTTTYNNGTSIELVSNPDTWSNLTTGAYCWYDNDEAQYAETYGALYNWYAVETGNLCPDGWHVPTDEEWKTLEIYLGMSQEEADMEGYRGTNEGSKLAGNSALWTDGVLVNNSEFGSSGFTALPGGFRNLLGTFVGGSGYWWSATEYYAGSAWFRSLRHGNSGVYRSSYNEEGGFSVRCLRD